MSEENIIKIKIGNTKFSVLGQKNATGLWDAYIIDPSTDYKELLRKDVTTNSLKLFSKTVLDTSIDLDHKENNNPREGDVLVTKNGSLKSWSNIFNSKTLWIIIGILVLIWFAYSMGKNGSRKLSPQEVRESINTCNQWGGHVIYDNNGQYQDCMTTSGKDY